MAKISNKFSGKTVCLDKANVDTDQIIPKQFLKSIKKTGLGPFLFDSWRYEDEGYLGKDSSKRTLKNDNGTTQERQQKDKRTEEQQKNDKRATKERQKNSKRTAKERQRNDKESTKQES